MHIEMILRRLVAPLLIGVAASASAQYSIQPTGPVTGSCAVDTMQNKTTFNVTVAADVNLPAGAGNMMLIGGSKPANLVPQTVTPAVGTLPGSVIWWVTGVPSPSAPVRLGLSVYPASGGVLTGTGAGTDVACGFGGVFSASAPVIVETSPTAPYTMWYSGSVIGGACSATGISGSIDGGLNVPPPTGPNIFAQVAINQGAPVTQTYTSNPAAGTGVTAFDYVFPATALPYTITGTFFPLYNGALVGTGVRVTYTCTANGLTIAPPETLTVPATHVPALNAWALLALAGLLAAGAVRMLRRA